ncbi:cysteine sulfinic acid decarboxylase [Cimex lectularius]|uniref:Black n=1 Tax=Cimex lectularius TaxID=79782 RepID=A0A8I6RMY8_CIMLE|nr:cysteine sulfinic acid decarboxylase [Cimex lectularius]
MPASGATVEHPRESIDLPIEPEGVDLFLSAPDKKSHGEFLQRVQQMLLDHAFQSTHRESKVARYVEPERLKEIMDLDLKREPSSMEALIGHIRDTMKYSVNTGHPFFVNQLFSSLDPYGLAGGWVTDSLNPSVYTYEVSPVFSLMEEAVLKEMRTIVGFTEGDGIFSPGGSIANGYAINCARFNKMPQIKEKGLHGLPRLVLFTSEDAHYSIKKMAALQGIGSDNVYLVKTEANGKMDVRDLRAQVEKSLEEGAVPFMVSATAGTTVLGAYDPIEEIHEVCKDHGMWLHVDAAWGGGALVSKKYRHLLRGIEKSDSVTWNPHKMLAAPQQCSTFLTKHTKILSQCHSAQAQYLFQKDKFYDTSYDTGDKHIQCGRRADVFKFWLMWKAKGTDGLEKHVDRVFDSAEYFTEKIRGRPGFKLFVERPECTNVTFWYVPPSLLGKESEPDFNQKLHKVAPLMKERMMREGTMMMTYQPLREHPNFFRLVIQNSSLNHNDMDYIVAEIERLGRNL